MKRLIQIKIAFLKFVIDRRAVAFDLMGIIFMLIAIVLGNMVGAMVAGMVGMGGGLIGAFIIGVVIYAIFCFLTGSEMNMMSGLIFAILVYISGIATTWIGSATGLTGGFIGLVLNAIVLSILWGYFGKGKSPLKAETTTKRTPRRKGRR